MSNGPTGPTASFNDAAAAPQIDLTTDFNDVSHEPDEPQHETLELTYDPPEPSGPGMSASPTMSATELPQQPREAFEERMTEPDSSIPDRDAHIELDFDDASGREYMEWSQENDGHEHEENTPEKLAQFDAEMREHFIDAARDPSHDIER